MKNGDCHFNFRRGFIEFHLFKDKEYYLEKLKLIIEWLINKKYNIEYYDVVSNEYFD